MRPHRSAGCSAGSAGFRAGIRARRLTTPATPDPVRRMRGSATVAHQGPPRDRNGRPGAPARARSATVGAVSNGHGHDHGHDHHGHHHHHAPSADADARWLAIALALIAGFMVVEVVGGVLASSLALLSDAGHMLTDAGAIALALVAARLAA